MLIGIPLGSIGFLGLSFVNSLLTLSLFQGTLVAIGMSAGFLLPVQTATANWFMRRRTAALAAICVAAVLGETIVVLSGEQIAAQFGWRGAFLGLGVVMLVICIPLAFVIRHKPERYGYLPDGELAVIEKPGEPVIEKGNRVAEIDFTLWQALRTKAIRLLTEEWDGLSAEAEAIKWEFEEAKNNIEA